MTLSKELTAKGYALEPVRQPDFADYLIIKKACYEKYVDEYFGGWVEDIQYNMQVRDFDKANRSSFSRKVLLEGATVGFLSFDDQLDKIEGMSIQMIAKAQNNGIGSCYLAHVTALADDGHKSAFLQVFKSNPAQELYKRFGFAVYDQTHSHYLMRYDGQ